MFLQFLDEAELRIGHGHKFFRRQLDVLVEQMGT